MSQKHRPQPLSSAQLRRNFGAALATRAWGSGRLTPTPPAGWCNGCFPWYRRARPDCCVSLINCWVSGSLSLSRNRGTSEMEAAASLSDALSTSEDAATAAAPYAATATCQDDDAAAFEDAGRTPRGQARPARTSSRAISSSSGRVLRVRLMRRNGAGHGDADSMRSRFNSAGHGLRSGCLPSASLLSLILPPGLPGLHGLHTFLTARFLRPSVYAPQLAQNQTPR